MFLLEYPILILSYPILSYPIRDQEGQIDRDESTGLDWIGWLVGWLAGWLEHDGEVAKGRKRNGWDGTGRWMDGNHGCGARGNDAMRCDKMRSWMKEGR